MWWPTKANLCNLPAGISPLSRVRSSFIPENKFWGRARAHFRISWPIRNLPKNSIDILALSITWLSSNTNFPYAVKWQSLFWLCITTHLGYQSDKKGYYDNLQFGPTKKFCSTKSGLVRDERYQGAYWVYCHFISTEFVLTEMIIMKERKNSNLCNFPGSVCISLPHSLLQTNRIQRSRCSLQSLLDQHEACTFHC